MTEEIEAGRFYHVSTVDFCFKELTQGKGRSKDNRRDGTREIFAVK